jgi:hypothetical protein
MKKCAKQQAKQKSKNGSGARWLKNAEINRESDRYILPSFEKL